MGADAGRQAVDDDLEDPADGVAGAERGVDFGFEAGFGFGVDAVEEDLGAGVGGGDFGPCGGAAKFGCADADDVGADVDAEFGEQHLGECSAGDAGGGLAGTGALEDVTGVREIVLEGAGEVGVAGARGSDGLVLLGVAGLDGEDLLPVLPVVVGEGHGDGCADGLAVADAGEDVGAVLLDAHAAAAAVALLPAPEFAVEERLVDGDAGGKSADEGDECFSVGFTGGGKT